MSGSRGVRLPPGVPPERNVSGQHRKFALEAPFVDEREAIPLETTKPTDPLLEYAEREGQLIARVAEQEREIAQLKRRLERAEAALADAQERLAKTAIHESPTNPPPRNETPSSDVPEDAVPSTRP